MTLSVRFLYKSLAEAIFSGGIVAKLLLNWVNLCPACPVACLTCGPPNE